MHRPEPGLGDCYVLVAQINGRRMIGKVSMVAVDQGDSRTLLGIEADRMIRDAEVLEKKDADSRRYDAEAAQGLGYCGPDSSK